MKTCCGSSLNPAWQNISNDQLQHKFYGKIRKIIHKFFPVTSSYLEYCTVIIVFQPRAKVATELLSELNDDVSGDFVEEVSIL